MLLRVNNERTLNLPPADQFHPRARLEPRSVFFVQLLILCSALLFPCSRASGQTDRLHPAADSPASGNFKGAGLKIYLRLPDESPFLGAAQIHVMRTDSVAGELIDGISSDVEGETIFPDVPAGSYRVEASAPGFITAHLDSEIKNVRGQRSIFLVMKPDLLFVKKRPTISYISVPANAPPGTSWLPVGIDQTVPAVDAGTSCQLPQLLQGTTKQMTRFVNNLEKFTATEHVEHFAVSNSLHLAKPETRNFQYVVTISRNPGGTFILDEFRNGSDDRSQLPGNVATEGLPAMALLFHPMLVNDFNFVCEGLGQWRDRPAWQIHFIQKPGKASRLRAYVTSREVVHVALKGRVWIDPGSFQVLRLESELVDPIKEIELLNDRSTIEYTPVQFQSQKEQIWLPNVAEIYVQRRDHRYYRRLTFTDFKLFNVDTSQNIQAPREFYSFTNSSAREITGVLTVLRADEPNSPFSFSLTIPAKASIRKFVGLGNDVNLPAGEVASATFVHQGEPGAVKVDAHLSKESSLDVISKTSEP